MISTLLVICVTLETIQKFDLWLVIPTIVAYRLPLIKEGGRNR